MGTMDPLARELALSLGDASEAERHLGPLCGTMMDAGIREPGELRFLGSLIEALVLLGRQDEAARLTDWLEVEATRVGRPSVRAAALCARGIILAADGHLDAAIASVEAGTSWAREAPLPLEQGRALLLLGRVQRRATRKREARASLEEAAALFQTIGASRWAENAHEGLGRIGGRAPMRGALSETERQVVTLVASGLSNKEVASALFVTPKAVEASLSRIFAKKGVRSRAELAALAVAEAALAKQ